MIGNEATSVLVLVDVPHHMEAAVSTTCVFCGSAGVMTGEHVWGDWLTRIGLTLNPVAHSTGPLNRLGRELGVRPPFRQKVRDVCGDCNHGWMSRLEIVAQRTLTPSILGTAGEFDTSELGTVAAWAHKTALTSMLVSSEQERASGHGLPPPSTASCTTYATRTRPRRASSGSDGTSARVSRRSTSRRSPSVSTPLPSPTYRRVTP
jgi:hypothetical protein